MDNLYYLAKSALKWNDEDFWDSSPRFLFKQMDLYAKYNKPSDEVKKSVVKNGNNPSVNTTVEKKKLGMINPKMR